MLSDLSENVHRQWILDEKANMVKQGILTPEEGKNLAVFYGNGMLVFATKPTRRSCSLRYVSRAMKSMKPAELLEPNPGTRATSDLGEEERSIPLSLFYRAATKNVNVPSQRSTYGCSVEMARSERSYC